MPTTIQTYYPLVQGNPFKMILEGDSGIYQLHFQREGNPWTDWPIEIMEPGREQVALIGSMARTVPVASGRFIWVSRATPILHPGRIIVTSEHRGFFVNEINRNSVNVSNVNLNVVEGNYCSPDQLHRNPRVVCAYWRGTLSHAAFLRDLYQQHLAQSLTTRIISRLAIAVAVGTGITMSLGFGPAAGMSGVGSGLGGVGNAIVSGIAQGTTSLMRQSFEEMTRIVHSREQADAHRNATRFWENNSDRMLRIICLSISNAVFNFATSFIPGGSINSRADMTMGTLGRMMLNRLGNNYMSVYQSIVEAWAQGNNPNWNSIQTDIGRMIQMRLFS